MSIEKLLEQHEAVVAEARKAATFGTVTAAQLTRLTDVQAQRAASIKQRIAALETSRKAYNAQVDQAIAALGEDLKALEQRIATDREAVEPVLNVIGRDRDRAVESGNTPAGKSTKGSRASARRRAKKGESDKG
jgi:hypothetical protein